MTRPQRVLAMAHSLPMHAMNSLQHAQRAAILGTLLLLTSACSEDERLPPGDIASTITHTLGTAEILSTRFTLAATLLDIDPVPLSEAGADELRTHLDHLAPGMSSVDVENGTLRVHLDAFPVATGTCTGAFDVLPASACTNDTCDADDDTWCIDFDPDDDSEATTLHCDDADLHGRMAIRNDNGSPEACIFDAKYSEFFTDFSALASLSDQPSDEDLRVNAQFRFTASDQGVWKGEAIGVDLQAFRDKPRSGTIVLQTPSHRVIATAWQPIGDFATLATIQWRSETWTGCVETEGLDECDNARIP